jgi:putative Ca2+/H+ antiporter (TMEM165/GDT1 family)
LSDIDWHGVASDKIQEVSETFAQVNWTNPKEIRTALESLFTPIFIETFLLVFFAEIGDRSQISVITLASTYNAVGVSVGAMIGHGICSSVAVVGGALMAKQVSPQALAFGGAGIFFLFGIMNLA